MKVSGYRESPRFDDAADPASGAAPRASASVTRVVAVLLIAVVLACVEREMHGVTHGSLTSAVSGAFGEVVRHLTSVFTHGR
ncbi:hypothetical protein [Pararobbsia silviterrae]|uniref:Uncharacterized protein n=1 Tax=Pararobbsia silviterrae TaxID=1792498 RepID=A0A494Y4D2_9BURK|nr:hypothetical protein [Pararobbsia silviterrae]RKP57576.1 hypothetical protein D7S86_06375 [Pararobbsia silviterrae]